ncbi:MAG: type II toxin-antitoxin system VapB family antitoxin [Burkholderiales bacterium]
MRTNVVLDDELVEEAFRYAPVKTKRELVDLALREFISNRRRRDVRELRGNVKIRRDYDHKKLRTEVK